MFKQALTYLKGAVGDENAVFQNDQFEAIDALVTHRSRVLLVQRTGWGKSMVYFLSAKLLRDRGEGPTLLISPLLSLMRDQIQAAERIGVKAETVNSTNEEDWDEIESRLHAGEIDVLIVSPEKLSNEKFLENFLLPIADQVGLIVIDEAHCISDWGHDFRPDYRRISRIISLLAPNIPVLATTATANNRVMVDVAQQLGDDVTQIRGPLVRQSLRLEAVKLPNASSKLAWLYSAVPKLPGSGIIYCLTKRDVEQVTEWLVSKDIDALPYHSAAQNRPELERKLLNNESKVLVATNALGMGFDKPDLGFVIHYQSPQSVVHYYQQVGRAGRAIDDAIGILLSAEEDEKVIQFFIDGAFPRTQDVQSILSVLEGNDEGCTVSSIEKNINLRPAEIEKVLKTLAVENPSPVLKTGGVWSRTANLFAIDDQRISRLSDQRRNEWAEIQEYASSEGCLMRFLEEALDDPYAEDCGRCANCVGSVIIGENISSEKVFREASRFLRHSEVAISPRKMWAKDAFPQYGFSGKITDDWQLSDGRALSRWGGGSWSALINKGKEVSYFDQELITAFAEMIRDRWKPDPYPEWLTCVPSLRDKVLVPDFAQRLANILEIPYVPVVAKVRETERQKHMLNGFHQANNLDGAFEIITDSVRLGPLLLIDDVVDSRWSMTIVGALLRQSGSGVVYPVALSATSSS